MLHDCLNFMETHLEKQSSKLAMEKYYTERADLVSILLSAASEHLSSTYGTKVLKLFNKLFQLGRWRMIIRPQTLKLIIKFY